jgi:hypothetical protein
MIAYTESDRKECKEFFSEGLLPLRTSPLCTLIKQLPYYTLLGLRGPPGRPRKLLSLVASSEADRRHRRESNQPNVIYVMCIPSH